MLNKRLLLLLLVLLVSPLASARGVYLSSKDFLNSAFNEEGSNLRVVRLAPATQTAVKQITGRTYPAKRIRYWKQDTRTAWILEQIGKTEAITVGVVVDHGKIHDLKILVFRESRGAEVRHSFFTEQFSNVTLKADSSLSAAIDGITGATLSVVAVRKVAKLALLFDQQVQAQE